jgi:hypothetical protein
MAIPGFGSSRSSTFIIADCNIPNRAQDLALLGNLDFFVGLLFEIEPDDRSFFEGTDRRQGSRGLQRPKGTFVPLTATIASQPKPELGKIFRVTLGRQLLPRKART